MNAPPQSARGFWSIERFVAFVLGPIVTAGSTWVSLWLGKHVPGVEVPAEAIYAQSAAVSLGIAGLFYKWLHGRQVEAKLQPVLGEVHTLEANPVVGGFIKTTVKDLEGLAEQAAKKAVELHVAPQTVTSGDLPPPDPIAAAAGDPAPSSAGQAADTGAAQSV